MFGLINLITDWWSIAPLGTKCVIAALSLCAVCILLMVVEAASMKDPEESEYPEE